MHHLDTAPQEKAEIEQVKAQLERIGHKLGQKKPADDAKKTGHDRKGKALEKRFRSFAGAKQWETLLEPYQALQKAHNWRVKKPKPSGTVMRS